MAELDSVKGIGLVEKVRRGLGKPDIIYVKNFASISEQMDEKEPANADEITEVGKSNFKKSENRTSGSQKIKLQEVRKSNFRKSENQTSGSSEIEPQEVGESNPNYTNYNQTYMNQTNYNHTEESYNNPINQSATEKPQDDVIDSMDDAQAYIELIKENINYDHHMKYDGYGEKELYDELFGIICEVVCVKRKSIRVAGEDYPYELVKSRFLKLNSSHLEYVIGCMKETTTKITNIKAYMITALYNAPTTINGLISQGYRDYNVGPKDDKEKLSILIKEMNGIDEDSVSKIVDLLSKRRQLRNIANNTTNSKHDFSVQFQDFFLRELDDLDYNDEIDNDKICRMIRIVSGKMEQVSLFTSITSRKNWLAKQQSLS